MPQMRECSSCGKKKPLTAEYFPSRPDKVTGGFRPQCLVCYNDARKNRYAAPPKPKQEEITPVEEHRLKKQVAKLAIENKQLVADLSNLRRMDDMRREAIAIKRSGVIKPREKKSGLREGTALALASDWHIEEEVRPEQVANRNRFNLDISAKRMTRFFEAYRYAIDFNRQIYKIRDAVLWLGGDLITNYLHDDNVESNLLSPVQAIAYASASIIDGIDYLLKDPEIERYYIPCNDGNHGRLTKQTRSATRIENSLEWLLYTILMRHYADEPRVQFDIAQSEQLFFEVYGRTIRAAHGDTVRYAGGVGGVTIPLYKAIARWDTVRRADLNLVGHFHQYTSLNDIIINGSLIGYGPYSMTIGARFEPPVQAFCMLDSQRFKTVSMPLLVSERSDDARAA